MAAERLAADAVIALTNLSGTVGAIQDDPDTPDAAWLTCPDASANCAAHVSLPSPSGPLTGQQEVRVRIRPTAAGSNAGTASVDVLAGGLVIASSATVTVSATQIIAVLFAAGLVADPSTVEVRVNGTSAAGKASNRKSVEVGAVEWNVQYTVEAPLEAHTAGASLFVAIGLDAGIVTARQASAALVFEAGTSAGSVTARVASGSLFMQTGITGGAQRESEAHEAGASLSMQTGVQGGQVAHHESGAGFGVALEINGAGTTARASTASLRTALDLDAGADQQGTGIERHVAGAALSFAAILSAGERSAHVQGASLGMRTVIAASAVGHHESGAQLALGVGFLVGLPPQASPVAHRRRSTFLARRRGWVGGRVDDFRP